MGFNPTLSFWDFLVPWGGAFIHHHTATPSSPFLFYPFQLLLCRKLNVHLLLASVRAMAEASSVTEGAISRLHSIYCMCWVAHGRGHEMLMLSRLWDAVLKRRKKSLWKRFFAHSSSRNHTKLLTPPFGSSFPSYTWKREKENQMGVRERMEMIRQS